ncbi:adenylate/guanylate cyclase domain-containing protein [Fulvivirga sedimenti]|uniref:Adenylate cyclase n=1 Tax=Fulvivirga sedimenti TaxID=2879465 RepID=A0A9X1HJS9_9BACT|nr:adenylate/guanylate cyclase domain-containing protein [Fulvivirga sedimenti]MCA6073464.1 tetratricopeptide repeat protein [Fulvivirga sedimenti]
MIPKTALKYVILCCLVTLTGDLFSQTTPEQDSLRNLLTANPPDSSRISILNNLAIATLYNEDIPGALDYATEANNLAVEIESLPGQALALKNMGLAYYYQGDFMNALDSWTSSKEVFEQIPDSLGIANMTSNLGAVFYSQGIYQKALDNYLQSLSVSQKLGDPLRITSVLGNIGGLYGQLKDYDKALDYFKQIEPYLKDLNDPQINAGYLMGIGEIYFKEKENENAREIFVEALNYTLNTQDHPHNLNLLGQIEHELGNNDKAVSYLNEAYRIARVNNYRLDEVQALIELGKIYTTQNPDTALVLFSQARTLADALGTNTELRDIYGEMSQVYASNGDYKNAYDFQRLFLAQKDSVFNIETDDKIRRLQFDYELEKKQDQIGLLEKEAEVLQEREKRQTYISYASFFSAGLVLLLAVGVFNRYRFIKRTNKIINQETARSENLLLNILPEETARELKQKGKVAAKKFDVVTVMFTDFKGFTAHSHQLSPEQLVETVDYYFSRFDAVMTKYGLEKIKTIGDAYMCAGGLPFPDDSHPRKMIKAAFEILQIIDEAKHRDDPEFIAFDIRIGINTGPVVAGVVGTKKFAYDIWGDTVNVAARMESTSEPGKINISENTYELIKDYYTCSFRGEIFVKNKGMMNMYFVDGEKELNHNSVHQGSEESKN